jgi:hypothetical protein
VCVCVRERERERERVRVQILNKQLSLTSFTTFVTENKQGNKKRNEKQILTKLSK